MLIIGCLISICFLGYYLTSSYTKLATQKKTILENEKRLLADSIKQDSMAKVIESYTNLISYYSDNEDSVIKYVRKIKIGSDSVYKSKDSSLANKAAQLEREGFNALKNNNLEVALAKFKETEKTSPSYHMAYEISTLLNSEKKNDLKDPKTQTEVKKQILQKFSWRAPKDLLDSLKRQVKP